MSHAERGSWLIIALLCLLVGDRLGGQRARRAVEEELKLGVSEARPSLAGASSKQEATLQGGEALDRSLSDELAREVSVEAEARALHITTPRLECPPCDCACEPEPPPKKKGKRKRKRLPKPKMSPLERAKLLAWVRAHSDKLKHCRDADQPIYRVHTTLTLKADASGVKRASLKAGEEVPREALRCLERSLLTWPPPPGLAPAQHPQLIFSLQLD